MKYLIFVFIILSSCGKSIDKIIPSTEEPNAQISDEIKCEQQSFTDNNGNTFLVPLYTCKNLEKTYTCFQQ